MAFYVNKQELLHRIKNGFITHDGLVDDEIYNIYKDYGINANDPRTEKIFIAVYRIINSMDDYGINLYPMEYKGAMIRSIRIQKGVTITELSRKAGLSKTALYRIESGKTKPFPETIGRIAKALEVDGTEFM